MTRDLTPRSLEQPEPGFYAVRLTRGGHDLAAEIQRIKREVDGHVWIEWRVEIDGEPDTGVNRNPWATQTMERTYIFGTPISAERHQYLLELRAWARSNNPDHPILHPRRAIRAGDIPTPF